MYLNNQSSFILARVQTYNFIMATTKEHQNIDMGGLAILIGLILAASLVVGWIIYTGMGTSVPDVTSKSIPEARKELEEASIYWENVKIVGKNFDSSVADDLENYQYDNSIYREALSGFDYTDEEYEDDVTIVSQSPAPGWKWGDGHDVHMTITVKMSGKALDQYKLAASAKESQDERENLKAQTAESLKQAYAKLDNVNRIVEPYGFPTVADRSQNIASTGLTPVFLDENNNNVTNEVNNAPADWQISGKIESINENTKTMWINVSKPPSPEETQGTSPQHGQAYYKNCKEVWNSLGHGISKGDPGYSSDLDADGDGKACEVRPNY